MKKFISIVLALAMVMSVVVSFATVASATTAPSVSLKATEILDWTVDPYKSKKTGFDWSSKGSQYKSYDVEVILKGVELSSTWSDEANDWQGDYTGSSLTGLTANLGFETTGTRNTDWKYVLLDGINSATASKSPKAESYGYGTSSVTALYPKDEETTIAATDEICIYHLLVTVDTTKPLTISIGDVVVQVGDFDDSYDSEFDMYNSFGVKAATYNTYDSTFGQVSKGAALVLGGIPTTYTIAFQDWNGSPLGSDTYSEGATVTAPTPSREGYTFTGWSPAFSETATGDVTYVAQYVEATPADVLPTSFKAYNKGATDNTDVKGDPVGEYTYNYGAAKFNNVTIEDSKYIYKLIAKSGELESDPIAIGTGNIEVQGTMSFMAIIKSASKAITGIVLRAVAK